MGAALGLALLLALLLALEHTARVFFILIIILTDLTKLLFLRLHNLPLGTSTLSRGLRRRLTDRNALLLIIKSITQPCNNSGTNKSTLVSQQYSNTKQKTPSWTNNYKEHLHCLHLLLQPTLLIQRARHCILFLEFGFSCFRHFDLHLGLILRKRWCSSGSPITASSRMASWSTLLRSPAEAKETEKVLSRRRAEETSFIVTVDVDLMFLVPLGFAKFVSFLVVSQRAIWSSEEGCFSPHICWQAILPERRPTTCKRPKVLPH